MTLIPNEDTSYNVLQLVIQTTIADDSGKYICSARNPHGSANAEFSLEVLGKRLKYIKLIRSRYI